MKIKLILALSVLFLYSCKSTEVIPGAERVRILEEEPKGCIYVGEVQSIQEEKEVGTLETQMGLETRIDLRNKAHKLGGNILVFLKGLKTKTLPGSAPYKAPTPAPAAKSGTAEEAATNVSVDLNEDTLVFIGTVFKCPSSIIHQ